MTDTRYISPDGGVPAAPIRGGPPFIPPAVGGPRGGGWDAVRKVWRRKWLVAAIAAGFMVAGAIATTFMTPKYTAQARVLIGVQAPQVTEIESVLKGLSANSETVQSEAYVITSRGIAERVARRLALDQDPEFNPSLRDDGGSWLGSLHLSRLFNLSAILDWLGLGDSGTLKRPDAPSALDRDAPSAEERFWERIVSRVLGRVDAVPFHRSHVVAIETQSENPLTAARLANTFSDVYIQQQLIRKTEATEKANEWLQARIGELRQKVEESERAVESHRRRHGLYETRSDTVVAQQLAELNRELIAAQNAKAEAESRLEQAESQVTNVNSTQSLPAVLQSPLIHTLRSQQSTLQQKVAELSAIYTAKHPKRRDIQAQIGVLDDKIRAEAERIVDGLRHQQTIAEDRYRRVLERMDELKSQMGAANEETVRLRQLEREAEADRNLLAELLQRSKETAGQAEILVPDAAVISRANVPLSPSFPPRNLIVLVTVFAGLGCGVLLALLIENLDQTFRGGEEVEEHTGLPLLALVPSLRPRGQPLIRTLRNPHSPFTGALQRLSARLAIDESASREDSRCLMFTSAVPGEGKSHTAMAFAQVQALNGHRTVVLDLDWKRPSLHRILSQPNRAGLAELLRGEVSPEEAVFRDRDTGLHAIFAGDVNLVRRSAVSFERLHLLLNTLSHHYDVVVLDTSPASAAPEVLHLSRLAQETVFVVKWASTPRRTVANELKSLLQMNARVPGIVLAQVNPRRYRRYDYGEPLLPHSLTAETG